MAPGTPSPELYHHGVCLAGWRDEAQRGRDKGTPVFSSGRFSVPGEHCLHCFPGKWFLSWSSFGFEMKEAQRLPRWVSGKESACNTGEMSSIPGSGGSPGEGNGNPLQCFCLRKPMNRGGWGPIVHGGLKESDVT